MALLSRHVMLKYTLIACENRLTTQLRKLTSNTWPMP
jgi:hypothetical protein